MEKMPSLLSYMGKIFHLQCKKNPEIFSCGVFLFCVVDYCLSKYANSKKTPLPQKIPGYMPEDIKLLYLFFIKRKLLYNIQFPSNSKQFILFKQKFYHIQDNLYLKVNHKFCLFNIFLCIVKTYIYNVSFIASFKLLESI